MFPIQHPQNKDTSVTRTIPQARHLWIKTFPALFTDVMSYITMSVVIIVPLTFHNMHTMNYVSYKYSVSIYSYLYSFLFKLKQLFQFFFSFFFHFIFWIGCRGNYGDGCLYACPRNCLNGNCDAFTGHCLNCSSGYYGPLCINGLYLQNQSKFSHAAHTHRSSVFVV